MVTDSIADMLTRIRNATRARQAQTVVPYSKLKQSLAELLLATGYLGGVQVMGSAKKLIQIQLKYKEDVSVITDLKRVSKPGQRMYLPAARIPRTSSGFGITVVSTSQGLMTDSQARKAKVGGEIICQVW
ncbi:MAG: 30S ribosomal protein S8 [Candidatus Doudnabacteria bacterium]|nr:30S ribosomal protein S8 [Candidatus Doudnabacteria bacterium]